MGNGARRNCQQPASRGCLRGDLERRPGMASIVGRATAAPAMRTVAAPGENQFAHPVHPEGRTPDRRPMLTPAEVVPVVHRRGPRRERARLKRAGERTAREVPVHPPGQPVGRADGQARFLKRQLSLPVSTMSQWWVRRSSSAVVILASPKTVGHSPNVRLVVTMTEVCS